MSKAQFYDPKQLRAPGEIHFQDIDVCKYQKTVADELKISRCTPWSAITSSRARVVSRLFR